MKDLAFVGDINEFIYKLQENMDVDVNTICEHFEKALKNKFSNFGINILVYVF